MRARLAGCGAQLLLAGLIVWPLLVRWDQSFDGPLLITCGIALLPTAVALLAYLRGEIVAFGCLFPMLLLWSIFVQIVWNWSGPEERMPWSVRALLGVVWLISIGSAFRVVRDSASKRL